jgi:type I site-specific restriction endonuclease
MQFELPIYDLVTKRQNGDLKVFDPVRKQFFVATPEELVRQNWLKYLHTEKEVPFNRMMVEKEVVFNRLNKRFDLVIVDDHGEPLVLFEFKAPKINLTQLTFNQAAVYNDKLNAKFLLISNGEQHFLAKQKDGIKSWHFLANLPSYLDLLN